MGLLFLFVGVLWGTVACSAQTAESEVPDAELVEAAISAELSEIPLSSSIEGSNELVAQATDSPELSAQSDVARVSDFLQTSVPVSAAANTSGDRAGDTVGDKAGEEGEAGQPRTVSELLASASITATTSAIEAVTPEPTTVAGVWGEINGALVNLRGGPGTFYGTVGQASYGQVMEIIGRNEEASWWLVCCLAENGAEGAESWVSAELVTLSSADFETDAVVERVPLAEIPPTPEAPTAPIAASSAGSAGGTGNSSAASLAAAPASGLPASGGFGAPGGTNPLTGLGLPAGRNGQRPVVVCINNDYAARPQFGTSNADVMYEYLMEGYGITRFSGVYYGEESAQIGPVRSARLINYYMGTLYDAGLTCSGASDPVRYMLKHEAPFPYLDIDLDDPSNARYSVSIGSDYRTRLRTSTPQLHQWLADWGVEKPASIRGFTFGNLPGGGVPATSVTVPYPSSSRSSYVYDGGSGRYLRSLGGSPHADGNTGVQIGVENVIVQYIPHETTDIVEDSLGSLSIRLNLFGSGRALLFRDGQMFETTWRSDSGGDMPHFVGADGAEVPLKPGKTWISVVPLSYGIEYQ